MTDKNNKKDTKVPVNLVSVYPKFISLKVGDYFHAPCAEVSPASAPCKEILWHSEDACVAWVHPSGRYISAIGPGSTKIYATAADGRNYSDCIFVVVNGADSSLPQQTQSQPEIKVSFIRIPPGTRTVIPGRSTYFFADVFPKEAANRQVVWSSDDPGIASVNPVTGLVYTCGVGETVIRALAQDGSLTRWILFQSSACSRLLRQSLQPWRAD